MTQFTYVLYGIILVHLYFACRIHCVLSQWCGKHRTCCGACSEYKRHLLHSYFQAKYTNPV